MLAPYMPAIHLVGIALAVWATVKIAKDKGTVWHLIILCFAAFLAVV